MMEEAISEAPPRFRPMALSQDKIGWRRFLEGMISKEITNIQQQYYAVNGSRMSLKKVVLRIDHPVAGDYARAVALSELCGA